MTKRKLLALMIALALALALFAACDRSGGTSGSPLEGDGETPSPAPTQSPTPTPTPGQTAAPTPEQPFEGKIAIITMDLSCFDEYSSAVAMQEKYGEDKIIIRVWPVDYTSADEQMIVILQAIAAMPDLRAVIINRAVIHTNGAVDKLLESRPDIFVAYCDPYEDPPDVARRANLTIAPNEQLRGETIIMQAKAMGAKVFAHYSFPRHMEIPVYSQRRDTMMEVCEREGIEFVDLTAMNPISEVGISVAQQFIIEDMPKQVARLGKDTAFFSTSCALQIPLITKVIDEGAIYSEPCCPSPSYHFPEALGIDHKVFDGANIGVNDDGKLEDFGRLRTLGEFISNIRSVVADRGATGRLATWPVQLNLMSTYIATEYAIKWINGEVPQEKGNIDYAAIEELCEAYIFEETGERLGVEINPLSQRGRTYDNYLLLLLDSIVF